MDLPNIYLLNIYCQFASAPSSHIVYSLYILASASPEYDPNANLMSYK